MEAATPVMVRTPLGISSRGARLLTRAIRAETMSTKPRTRIAADREPPPPAGFGPRRCCPASWALPATRFRAVAFPRKRPDVARRRAADRSRDDNRPLPSYVERAVCFMAGARRQPRPHG